MGACLLWTSVSSTPPAPTGPATALTSPPKVHLILEKASRAFWELMTTTQSMMPEGGDQLPSGVLATKTPEPPAPEIQRPRRHGVDVMGQTYCRNCAGCLVAQFVYRSTEFVDEIPGLVEADLACAAYSRPPAALLARHVEDVEGINLRYAWCAVGVQTWPAPV
ncbi:hypothetical protein KCU61_g512, partial [Aureobasidium melanogenum]